MTKYTSAEQLPKEYVYHHTALRRGYVSRKGHTEIVQHYSGRFGVGYTVDTANYSSTNYCYRAYYIKGEA